MPTEHVETARLLGAGHQHDLEVIEAVAEPCPGTYLVVRWCKVCGAAGGMRRALVSLARQLPSGAEIISTIHDEIILGAPEIIADTVKEIM